MSISHAASRARAGIARSARVRWMLVAVAAVLAIWVLVAAYLLLTARRDLVVAESNLDAARGALVTAEFDGAATALRASDGALGNARSRLTSPVLRPLDPVPVIGPSIEAAAGLARGAQLAVDAGSTAVDAVTSLPGGAAALRPVDGRLPVEHLASLAPALQQAADTLAEAADVARAAPRGGAVERIRSSIEEFVEIIDRASEQVDLAAALATDLPTLLGADRPRRYLFATANPAELRGTGGYLGTIGVLTIAGGTLEFGETQTTSELPDVPPEDISVPPDAQDARLESHGGPGFWQNLNYSPHFPAVALALEQLWERTQGDRVDGTVVVDPFAFELLLELTGPVTVPGYREISAASAVDYVTNDAYREITDPDVRRRLLGDIATVALQRFLESGGGDLGPLTALETLGELGTRGHLLIHSADSDVQETLERTPVAGELPDPPGDFLAVVGNSGSAAKLDYYAQRDVVYTVQLDDDGSARGSLEVTVSNEAPAVGLPPYIIGPNNPTLEAGENLTRISVYLTRSATFVEVPEGDPDAAQVEVGHPVHDTWVRVPSRESTSLAYAWRIPDVWEPPCSGDGRYRFTYDSQTVINETEITVRIPLPEGMEVRHVPNEAVLEGGSIVYTTGVRGDTVELELALSSEGC